MESNIVLNPRKPEFDVKVFPEPNYTKLPEYADGYTQWAENYHVAEDLDGSLIRVIGTNLKELAEQPIPHGEFAGQRRFISEEVARAIGVEPNPLPEEDLFFARGSVARAYTNIAYHQGSSEYGSTQQQAKLLKMDYKPPIFEEFLRSVMIEEGEHGFQMLAWLVLEGGDFGCLLAEDLLARRADDPDPDFQQPLVEFNPLVTTLPEFAHYLDNQDRDGWSQLRNSQFSGSALYAAQMQFFLRQEARHMGAGERLIEWYLEAGRIPMDLHLKMSWEWNAMSYRLHGNPYGSDGALTAYQLGIKNPIFPLSREGNLPPYAALTEMQIPHMDGEGGFKVVQIGEDMDLRHLNGYSVSVLRNLIMMNNIKRSRILSSDQRREMKSFLRRASVHVPEPQRSALLEEGVMPTAALSWRPEHLAGLEAIASDPWYHMSGFYTDVFGNPISEVDYLAHREVVGLAEADREVIRDLTSTPGWMVEYPVDSRQNIYRSGAVNYRDRDTQLFEFRVGKKSRNMTLFTVPQAFRLFKEKQEEPPAEEHEQVSGWDFLNEHRGDILGTE